MHGSISRWESGKTLARHVLGGYTLTVNNPLTAQRAILRLLATAWDPASAPSPETIPWHAVARLVEATNIAAAIYVAARNTLDAVPVDVRHVLEREFYRTAAANARLLEQLRVVQHALADAGVPMLLLKGAALVQSLYYDTTLRLIGDIDLAVPLDCVPVARQVILAAGYRSEQMEERPGNLLTNSNQELFDPPTPDGAPIELHWHLLDVPYYLRRVPMSWFWEHSTIMPAMAPCRVLNPEANLVYLPAHLALHHRFDRLHSLFDVALLVSRHGHAMDWESIASVASGFELLSALRATIDLVAEYWPGLPLAQAQQALCAVRPSLTDRRLYRLLTSAPRSTPLHLYTTLATQPELHARLRFLWVHLFPQPSYMVARYRIRRRWQLPFWYAYRLLDGLARYLVALPRTMHIDRGDRA